MLLRLALLALVMAFAATTASPASAQEGPGTESAAGATEAPTPNTVTAYGSASDHGPGDTSPASSPLVAMAGVPGGDGYWLAARTGGVFTFGSASVHGSAGDVELARPIVGMAAHPSGQGYWLVAPDGGVFAFGAARFHGSTGGQRLNQPIVGMASTPSGGGYWLVAADGGIFSFGDAAFFGSTGDISLVSPIVGMARATGGDGYWLVAADGGVFSFGDARFFGSEGGRDLPAPVVGMAAAPDGSGYWLAGRNGQVYAHGVADHGSAAEHDAVGRAPTAGIVASGPGGYWLVHSTMRTARPDQRGAHVATIQRRLQDLGYWLGPIDGVYGETTEQAVYAFQKYEGLAVDGIVGPNTRAALDTASRPVPRGGADSIEVDKSRQLLFVVRGGRTHFAFNTSTGTEDPYTFEGEQYLADTPPGRWTISRAVDGYRVSNLGRLYRPRYFHRDGIAIHGSPLVPPYPASHGCVRVTNAAMDFIWANDLAPLSSEVWVYGQSPTD